MMKANSFYERLSLLAGAVFITTLLFLLLPLSYYFFHENIYEALNKGSHRKISLDSVSIEKKKEPKKEIIRREEKKAMNSRQDISRHFNLDLSVLAEGEGEGMVNASRRRILEDYEADIPPVKKFTHPPEYPRQARRAGVSGTVSARILINEKGEVESVTIKKAPRGWGFEYAVKEALSRWQFEPAKMENMPIRVWAHQEIEFAP